TMAAMESARRLYWERRFPYNWLIFLAVLSVLVVPIYLVASTVVWSIAPPAPQTLGHYLRTGWKFPILITVVFSVGLFLYETTRERLERRNRELQSRLAQGTAQIEQQEEELRRAREIQQALLPKEIPQLPGFEIAAAWRPALAVSGDYFDVFPLDDHKLCISIADVVGKGVSAALLMAHAQAAVRALASTSDSPAGLCARVNRLLCENIATGKFVTFFYGILDSQTRTFAYCNAGHPHPILISHGQASALDKGGAVLGVFPAWVYEDGAIRLHPDDRLLLFTDGITEAESGDAQEFGDEKIAAFAEANPRKSARDLTSGLLERVSAFCGGRFQDDATLVVVAAN
ncbi:MAG TPA: PP2C family protein-serine/threonine phosphatase, partial [Candidatus Sulfopaludibacter sp.]|nr:PP2C family protein-serine/threonine phosphatase [Candidatus Sulfopaludibacter sp.]